MVKFSRKFNIYQRKFVIHCPKYKYDKNTDFNDQKKFKSGWRYILLAFNTSKKMLLNLIHKWWYLPDNMLHSAYVLHGSSRQSGVKVLMADECEAHREWFQSV